MSGFPGTLKVGAASALSVAMQPAYPKDMHFLGCVAPFGFTCWGKGTAWFPGGPCAAGIQGSL